MDRSWVLVGMMGAGKSSVGRSLAEISEREFIDTDSLLQHRLGRPIPQIFQLYGEHTFREHETSVLRSIEPGRNVVSTGGGVVLRPENWNEMRRLGHVIYLRASLPLLIDRLETSKKKRPLLQTENWRERLEELLNERQPAYEMADIIVDVENHEFRDGAKRLEAAIRSYEDSC